MKDSRLPIELRKSAIEYSLGQSDCYADDSELLKSEGSKGGKVIGHTKSGKPIYGEKNHSAHKNFTIEDHEDAQKVNENRAKNFEIQEKNIDRQNKRGKATIDDVTKQKRLNEVVENHRDLAEHHFLMSRKGIKKSDTVEKGGQEKPIGTERISGGNVFKKQPDGKWKYIRRAQSHEKEQANASASEKMAESLGSPESEAENAKVDINERFAAYSRYTKAVISGKFKSAIAYGTGGVGKSYTVLRELDAAGKTGYDEDIHKYEEDSGEDDVKATKEESMDSYDYIKISGQATPVGLYRAMYEHNGKLLIFDDCDSVLKNETAVNLLKGALDTTGDGAVSYASGKELKGSDGEVLPQRFKFTGRIIFISNLNAKEFPQPLKSRSLCVDLTMDRQQTVDRLEFIATNPKTKQLTNLHFPGTSYQAKDMRDVLDFVKEHKHNFGDLSVRTVGAMLAIKQQAEEEGIDWKKDAEHMVFSKAEIVNNLKKSVYSEEDCPMSKAMQAGSTTGTDTTNKTTTMEGLKKEDVEGVKNTVSKSEAFEILGVK